MTAKNDGPLRRPQSADADHRFSLWLFNNGFTTESFLKSLPGNIKPHWVTVNRWRAGLSKPSAIWRREIKRTHPGAPL